MSTAMSIEQPSALDPPPLKLLSLDGGGIRGLSSLIILKYLMKRVNPENPPKPCEYFDLIGGTSTGGLIALMLGRLHMDVDTCITKYCELSSIVFQPKRLKANFMARFKDLVKVEGKYRSDHLEEEVKKMVEEIEQDAELNLLETDLNPQCRVFVCAFTKALNTPVRLRSYKTTDSVDALSSSGCTIWQAARATSAAATFFDPIKIGSQQYVDGATGYNNPVRVVLDEAKSIWPDALLRIQSLVSIGTGVPDLKDFGDNIKQVMETIKSIATETETTEQMFYKEHSQLGVGGRYFRLNVDQGLGGVGLDEHKKRDKIEAASELYLNNHRIRDQVVAFIAARAPLYMSCNESDKKAFLSWLPSIDPLKHHNRARQRRTTKTTGQWFLRGEFNKWKSEPGSFLWLYAAAGSGKTVLTSSIIDEIKLQRLGIVAYFYFSIEEKQMQDIHHFKHSILTQLVSQLTRPDGKIPNHYSFPFAFRQLFLNNFPSTNPCIEHLDETLDKILQGSEEVYLVIDALNECPLSSTKAEVITFLDLMSHRRNTHILMTSQREVDIETPVTSLSNKTIVPLKASTVDKDIRSHILGRMAQEPYHSNWSDELQRKVVDYITEHSGGIFRWADLLLEELSSKAREKDIDRTFKQLPKDMEESYSRILQQIDRDGYARDAQVIFTWLAYAPAQLTLRQAMEIALFDDVKQGQPKSVGDDRSAAVLVESNNDFQKPNWIRRILSSLIELSDRDEGRLQVDRAGGGDDEIISFAHSSVKDYLENNGIIQQSFHISDLGGKLFIFDSCLAYIEHYDATCLRKSHPEQSEFQKYPLLYYVCQYWPSYSLELHNRNDSDKAHIVRRLKKAAVACIHAGSTLSARVVLELAIVLGNMDLVEILLDTRLEHDIMTVTGGSLLHVAAERNNAVIVDLLLHYGADANVLDQLGQTPLIIAVKNRSREIAQLLVRAGANTRACRWPVSDRPEYRIPTLFSTLPFLTGPQKPFMSNPLDPLDERSKRDYINKELTVPVLVMGAVCSLLPAAFEALGTGLAMPYVFMALCTAATFGIPIFTQNTVQVNRSEETRGSIDGEDEEAEGGKEAGEDEEPEEPEEGESLLLDL